MIFAQREVDGGWERRIEAEQTEVEPEPPAQEWPGWECGPLCAWMLSQLDQPAGEAGETARATGAAPPEPAAESAHDAAEAATPAPPAAGRAELRIDGAVLTDAQQTLDLVRRGYRDPARYRTNRRPRSSSASRHRVAPASTCEAAVWFRRTAEPGWSPADPVSAPESGRVQFDLSPVPRVGMDVRVLAWATVPVASLAAVTVCPG